MYPLCQVPNPDKWGCVMKGVRTIKNEQEKEEEDWKLMYGCNDKGNQVILLCCLRHLSLSTKVKFNLSTGLY